MKINTKLIFFIFIAISLILGLGLARLWNTTFFSAFSVSAVEDISSISSPALYDRNGTLFHVRLSEEGEWSLPIPLERMGKWLPIVAVAVEDKRFYSHFGMDIPSIFRALWQNLTSRKIISGASTISSQVVRLAVTNKITKYRGLSTKITEFIGAVKLDSALPKEKILEIYLNRAPFGGNIRGVEAASRVYFGKRAETLSPGEACLLIGMLVAPTRYRPDTQPENALKRRDFIIRQLEREGVFSSDTARLAFMERLPSGKNQMPFRAYHYYERLLSEKTLRGRSDTGLDLNIQTALENTLRAALLPLPANITAAAGIIDNNTKQLVAWVGNARFGQYEDGKIIPGTWVDCGSALRSPGSALKSFAWLAAFDSGLLTPASLLSDTPIAFSGRAPRNFDLTYRGAVSARVALADSLNAPAVRVLRRADPERVIQLMRESGFSSLTKNARHYGDSLILGGCEVKLTELLDAYATVADGGRRYYGSRFLPVLPGSDAPWKNVFSPEAAWLISDILSDTRRLSFIAREVLQFDGKRVAFKTGTSYGLRDAWTIAWTPQFTIAVWFGDPSGMGWDGLIGLNIATPPAFKALRLASALDTTGFKADAWFGTPGMIEKAELCSLSGKTPSAACPSMKSDWMIKDVSNRLPCNLHTFRDGGSVTIFPPELEFIHGGRGKERESSLIMRSDIKIVSPIPGGRYVITSVTLEPQKIPFRAEGGQRRLFWFVDGAFVGDSPTALQFFYALEPGRHDVSVMDSLGRTATVHVDVVTVAPRDELLDMN